MQTGEVLQEFYAKRIHGASRRSDKQFVVINCATLPKGRIDSELFGHVKGAFTGAMQDRLGKIREAKGGTVFLDEIGDLPDDCWGNLLRFLQDKEIHPLSGQTQIVNVRILAATNRQERVRKEAVFRFDHTLCLPPLRARRQDIQDMAEEFFQAAMLSAARTSLRFRKSEREELSQASYDWPGNIRQLEKAIQQAIHLHDSGRDLTCEEVLKAAKSARNFA